ncbi:MAG: hypothetical protein ABI330_15550 [Caldimonas sp.]
MILSPFNYEKGYARGLELSSNYNSKNWGGYLNLTYQKAQGRHIVSGQSLFGQDELSYIAQHYIHLDHDQTYTASGGVSYKFGDSRISSDVLFGSGLRRTPDGGPPNGAALPSYTVTNATLTHTWGKYACRIGGGANRRPQSPGQNLRTPRRQRGRCKGTPIRAASQPLYGPVDILLNTRAQAWHRYPGPTIHVHSCIEFITRCNPFTEPPESP